MTAEPLAILPLERPPDASVRLPGSKSITNRALVAAALAAGTSTVDGLLLASDTEVMLTALAALGAGVIVDREAPAATVTGVAAQPAAGPIELYADQSGTTARFLLGLLTIGRGRYRLDGHPQLRARPMGPMLAALEALGCRVVHHHEPGCLPVTVEAPSVPPGERAELAVPGHVSSQFVSGLLLAGPARPGGLELTLTSPPVSTPYLAMTVSVMEAFGAEVEVRTGPGGTPYGYAVAGTGYRGIRYRVEPDASAASYFLAAAAITGGRVVVEGLGPDSIQGDVGFARVLASMGARTRFTSEGLEVRGPDRLTGIEVDLGDMSDTAPTLAAVAAFARGSTRVTGIGFIRRTKESDRVAGVVTELRRCGIDAEVEDDGFVVRPGRPHGAVIRTYDDHRMAMGFALLGLRIPGISIADPGCVAKTFPGYFEMLDQLRGAPAPVADTTSGGAMATRPVIAIDGPAGSGKSTVARAVADRLELPYLDTGAMYRAVAFAVLRAGIDPEATEAVAALAADLPLSVTREAVVVDGVDATVEIRGVAVTRAVSAVAANPAVRAELVSRQREWIRRHGGGVLEGRDIGTVVAPDADVRVYLTASSEERARRRAREVAELDVGRVAADITRRDRADATRADSPLLAEDQLGAGITVIDTTDLDVDEVVAHVVELLDAD